MLRFTVIPFLVLFVTICIAAFVVLISKRKPLSRDEELNKKYIYRKEPMPIRWQSAPIGSRITISPEDKHSPYK